MTSQNLAASPEIRPASLADAEAIAEIFNHAVLNTVASWLLEPVTVENRQDWLRSHHVLVAEISGQVVGFAGYGQYRPAAGYRFTVENSVYIREGFYGRGLAGSLMESLITEAREQGLRVMLANIEAGNVASIKLHEKLGFRRVGLFPGVGDKNNQRLDLAILQLDL
ncbi:GNAT family N-acetyltransferase [Corynebacterium epidermidicanis]|uniref:Sortase-like acyltransferase n=1 Tax=Corynebacterium epidermidicanis TaxID=1050174 RepID=A0A0G3GTR8_9CORY|nr:GNAT family N-acetyltransferase [Corynebacterium epidermidicanis]AKK03945.1 sortase-like acyltransferase [Corynebacterium epidermidicanis]